MIRSPFKDLPREVSILVAASFFVAVGFGIVMPAIPVFAKSFGVNNAAIGLMVSAFAITRFCSGLISGTLVDRFGEIPQPGIELLAVAALRLYAKSLGLTDIAFSGKHLRLTPIQLPESAQIKLARVFPGSIYKSATQILLVARPSSPNWIESAPIGDTSTLAWVDSVLKELIEPLVNNKRT